MSKVILIWVLFCLPISFSGQSQSSTQPGNSGYAYVHPSTHKESWQRLLLKLSSAFIVVAKEGQVDHDSCLYVASRSLGISRFPVLAEGLVDSAESFGHSQWIDKQQPDIGIRLLSEATGKRHLQLLILLGSYYAFQPDSYYRYKDSVEYFLNEAVSESKALKEERLGRQALCLLGKMYVQVNDLKGDSIFNLLINQCQKAGDKETEARAFAYRGIYTAPRQATLPTKVTDLQKAVDLYHSLGNTEEEINVLTDLGYLLVVTGQLQAANETFLKALTLVEAIQYPYTHYTTAALAMVTLFQGKFSEPLRYTLQTIKVAESSRDSIGWSYFYSRQAALFESEGRQKESFDMTQKAIKRFVIDRNPAVYGILNTAITYMGEARAKEALSLTLAISKQVEIPRTFTDQYFYHFAFSNCYLNLGELDLAETHIKKMDSLETKAAAIRGSLRKFEVNNLFGFLYFKRGQYRKAKENFEKYFTMPNIQRNLAVDLNMYRWLITIDSIFGDNVSTISHYKKYTQLLDSNFKTTKIRQAEELQVMYETQEKESQIALLNEQAALEKANLRQATLVKNLTLTGIAAVIIIAGLLYRQNRLRKKNNKLITHKNKQLEDLLDDKEWLLKEVHHRVKNNLQIVMSLLNSQSVYIHNDAARTAIHDSHRRVYAMSLIHQKLYQSENIASINIHEYISELVNYVHDGFNTGNRIVIEQDIEPLELDVSQAIPLGLIVNECMVNAFKYAFPSERKGTVRISLQYDGADQLLLNISDNGIGLPDDIDLMEHDSLGLDLIRGLAKQLNGSIHMVSHDGMHITIRFTTLDKQFLDKTLVNF